MVSSSPTHRVTVGHWGRISAWMQTRDLDQENALWGFFFSPCDYRHIEILWEKMMLCLVTAGRKAPLDAASLGCPNHIFKGRSLVICSWLQVYHCAHMSGSTSVAKITDNQFWFYSFLSLYLTSSSLKCNLTPRAVTQEMMTPMGRGSIQILTTHSVRIHACTLLKSTWFVLVTFPNNNTKVDVEKQIPQRESEIRIPVTRGFLWQHLIAASKYIPDVRCNDISERQLMHVCSQTSLPRMTVNVMTSRELLRCHKITVQPVDSKLNMWHGCKMISELEPDGRRWFVMIKWHWWGWTYSTVFSRQQD